MKKRRRWFREKSRPTLDHGAYRTMKFALQFDPWLLRFDGGVTGNGRPDAYGRWGYVLRDEFGDEVTTDSGSAVGHPVTVNTCEWQALASGLRMLATYPPVVGLRIEGDSNLVICQLAGRWSAKADALRVYRRECLELLERIACPWTATWIPREQNAECDALTR